MTFDRFHKWCELLSFIAVMFSIPFAAIELHTHAIDGKENAKKERIEAAEKIYRDVDQRYVDFMRLCLDHPRLDCYSVPRDPSSGAPLDENEQAQQKILYTSLTDVFEVAYVQYHKKTYEENPVVRELYKSQWDGWDVYIRKFLARPAYRRVWWDIRDEYDKGLVAYMDTIAPQPKR